MFYRRKIILALIELLGGRVEERRLNKLMFLFAAMQAEPTYQFIALEQRPHSFSLFADLATMVKREFLMKEGDDYLVGDQSNYFADLKAQEVEVLNRTLDSYGKLSTAQLVEIITEEYPSFTKPLLVEQAEVLETILYTIGYEGVSIEAYLKLLIDNKIKLLVDVRANARSQKFGFSKSRLASCCRAVGIEYLHIPELGIQKNSRSKASTPSQFAELFETYRIEYLPTIIGHQQKLLNILFEYRRVALTCFEANANDCHRLPLAEALLEQSRGLKMTHL